MDSKNVAYICSDVRSGSTLLDMILGRHPSLTSVGELHHLHAYLNDSYYRQQIKEDTCACEKKLTACTFWSRVISLYKQEYNTEAKDVLTRFPGPANHFSANFFNFWIAAVSTQKLRKNIERNTKFSNYKKVAENRFNLYKIINRVNKSAYVVDSTKKIRDLKSLLAYNPEPVKAIFLTRDLRAIATSKFKRQPGLNLPVTMLQTMLFHIQLFLAVKSIPKEKRLVVRYEDLVVSPQTSLKNISLFLGIDPGNEIDLQAYCESHILGGSPHRLTNKKLEIYVDDRWKQNKGVLNKFMNAVLVFTSKVFYIKAG